MTHSNDPFGPIDPTLIAIHEAHSGRELAPPLFKLIAQVLPHEMCCLLRRPLESELNSYCSRPEYQWVCDRYVDGGQAEDIWMQRSPVRPDISIIRHSKFTPPDILHQSSFYENVLRPTGCEYGVSLVAWHRKLWLGCLTIFRTEAQGDFRDDETPILEGCLRHFQSAVYRIANWNEGRLLGQSLENLLWSMPTAIAILDWDMKILCANATCQEAVAEWKAGPSGHPTKRARHISIPTEIVSALEDKKATLGEIRPNVAGGRRRIRLETLKHPRKKDISAELIFIPSRKLAIGKGAFMVIFKHESKSPDSQESYRLFSQLTPREREVAILAGEHCLTSIQIAKRLNKQEVTVRAQLSRIYPKLRVVNRRAGLVRWFALNKSTINLMQHMPDAPPANGHHSKHRPST
jgi:DNA-binding CsgD family transcriptional regulator